LEVRNAEVLGRDGEVLVKQNPVTGEYEAVGINKLLEFSKGKILFDDIRTALESAQAPYKGSTVIGHALSKHA
ncbi:hypothetical protein, partial [Achromobacter sp. 413638]|uniref:hypothetical protein n=1 Tax=Achromobacter sp. 413638 TaxID=3342385 RepID=UPI00370CF4E0